jgi:hypothetical protein
MDNFANASFNPDLVSMMDIKRRGEAPTPGEFVASPSNR